MPIAVSKFMAFPVKLARSKVKSEVFTMGVTPSAKRHLYPSQSTLVLWQ